MRTGSCHLARFELGNQLFFLVFLLLRTTYFLGGFKPHSGRCFLGNEFVCGACRHHHDAFAVGS